MIRIIKGRKRYFKPLISIAEQIGITITLTAFTLCIIYGIITN